MLFMLSVQCKWRQRPMNVNKDTRHHQLPTMCFNIAFLGHPVKMKTRLILLSRWLYHVYPQTSNQSVLMRNLTIPWNCILWVFILISWNWLNKGHTNTQGPSPRCANQTKVRGLSEEARNKILEKHNQLRRKVAKGEEAGQPPAANMRKMVRILFVPINRV